MKLRAIVALLALTFAVTVSIGPYVVSLEHTVGGETRVSRAFTFGRLQKGRTWCLWDVRQTQKLKTSNVLI